jgi:hypothetical protein
MKASRIIDREIRVQKRIIADLKREIFGIDKTNKSSYIKDFNSEFKRYERICSTDLVIDRAAKCDVVYFGDYHPLERSQWWVLRLMKELTARGRKVVLALEMLYVHQQEFLDQWMKGKITEEQFLAAVDYYSEWGFRWKSYRRIFEQAKDPFIPIFGIDSEPRDHLRYIRMRDRLISRRLETIRKFFPGHLILVVIGESHLASNHLPALMKKAWPGRCRDIIIVQNIDDLYWQLLRSGKNHAAAVKVDRRRYCIFTTSPILKYESYREVINYWTEGEKGDRKTPVLLDMADNILDFLIGSGKQPEVTISEDYKVTLDDAFPDIHYRMTYKAISSHLRSMKVSPLGVAAAQENLKACGASYVPAINDFLIVRFDSLYTARETARFIVYAMRDEIGRANKVQRRDDDRFYAFVVEEALAYLGSKIINPTQDCLAGDPLLAAVDSRGIVRRPIPRFSLEATREIASLLKYHIKRERSSPGAFRITPKLMKIYQLEIKQRLPIVRSLGHTLGEAIYRAFHEGKVERKELVGLFAERFDRPGEAASIYMDWVKKTKPFRGNWGRSK